MVVRTGLELNFAPSRKIENPIFQAKSASDLFAFRCAFSAFGFKTGFGMGYFLNRFLSFGIYYSCEALSLDFG